MTGYREPPKDTQFKKGQSGNPNGRPKGTGNLNRASRVTLEAAHRKMAIRDGGVPREVTVAEAIELAQQQSALRGSALAQKHFLDRYEKAAVARREEVEAENDRWREIVETLRTHRAQADSRGGVSPMPYPHPDDVIIDPEKGVMIVGPINETEDAQLHKGLKMRDVLFAQDIFDHRYWEPHSNDRDTGPGGAGLLAFSLDRLAPVRYRLSDFDIITMIMRYERMTKRELTKFLFRSWRELGAAPCRGAKFASLGVGKQVLSTFYEAVAKAREQVD